MLPNDPPCGTPNLKLNYKGIEVIEDVRVDPHMKRGLTKLEDLHDWPNHMPEANTNLYPYSAFENKHGIGIYKLHESVVAPEYATEGSACFDIRGCFWSEDAIKIFGGRDGVVTMEPDGTVEIMPGETMLIPTGIIFDIPAYWSVRLHSRSGLSTKGIVLANAEGVIDSDYVEEVFLMVKNVSQKTFIFRNGDRLAQGEPVPVHHARFHVLDERPEQKTSRDGGFGSTKVE